MRANINVTHSARPRRILLVTANPSTSPVTGWPVGCWWAELTHPWWAFAEVGYVVDIRSPQGGALRATTPSIADVRVDDYDAIFVAGGQSPMITMVHDTALHQLVAAFHDAGKITALVCHATCVLLHARCADGELMVKGRTWTGFADAEEQFVADFVGQRTQPFWIETEARKIPDTNFVVDQRFREFAVRDGQLITGQQQFSGAAAARLLIEALGR